MPNDETPPTPDEWRRALDAALAFRDAAPWTWMTEENVFGVQDPETGVTYYACVLGALGEMTALALYEGAAGLDGLWRMRTETFATPLDTLMLQRCLMASFEDREVLQQADRDVLKSLGIKVRGRGAWPMLRSYLPGYTPWHVTGAQARFLALALEQALVIAQRSQEDSALLPYVPPGGAYLVRTRQDNGEWTEERRVPEPLEASDTDAAQEVVLDTERLQQMKETLPMTRGVLEMDFLLSPNGIQDENGGRPFFPLILMAADQDSGLIVGNDLSRPDAIAQDFGEMLLTILENVQMLPARVETAHAETLMYLEPFAGPLGIQVSLVPQLRAIQPAMEELALILGGGFGLDLPGLLESDLLELDEPEPAPRRLRRRASRASDKAPASVYQLKITLRDSKPPIWRRVLVPGSIRLDALHDVIQSAMGWTNSHLHAFEIDGGQFGVPDPDLEMENERKFRLDQLVPDEGGKFVYNYDFGDSWDHTILVEKILPPTPDMDLPVCLTGKRACPPEDCGGVWGYAELIEVMQNPKHPDYKEMREWLGGKLAPEAFSVDEVNRRLRRSR